MMVLFLSASIPPGLVELADSADPLSYGFASISSRFQEKHMAYMSLPSLFAAALSFTYLSAKVFRSVSLARLFPGSIFNPELSQLNPDFFSGQCLSPGYSQKTSLVHLVAQTYPDMSQLNPNLSQLNPNLSQLNSDLSQLNPEPVTA